MQTFDDATNGYAYLASLQVLSDDYNATNGESWPAINFGGLISQAALSFPGDFDNDGDVDGTDLAVFAADYGRRDCSGDCPGDFDNDGDVDHFDLDVFEADFGETVRLKKVK